MNKLNNLVKCSIFENSHKALRAAQNALWPGRVFETPELVHSLLGKRFELFAV